MNRDDTVLDLHLRLLVAQHGKARVSKALAAIEDTDLALVRGEIETYQSKARRSKPQRRPRRNIKEVVRNARPDSPEAEEVIGTLARAYESKEFLPELRDVRRFLNSRSTMPVRFRSRADALPAVIGALARCGLDELHSLDKERRTRGSDLGIITDQILGRTANHSSSG